MEEQHFLVLMLIPVFLSFIIYPVLSGKRDIFNILVL